MSRTHAPLTGLLVSLTLGLPATAAAQDVPLSLWVNATWPGGLDVGLTNGVSCGDFNGDGWVDFYAARSGRLWENLGGVDWQFHNIFTAALRYGSSFGDYNNDGLPDIADEPRASGQLNLLKNLGGGPNFQNVAGDPAIVDVRPHDDAETNCWADVDFDGDLDLFVPVYPAFMGGPGNFFLYNLGPTGPGGEYRFTEISGPVGLDNPAGAARPEGAEFCDIDGDGDLDLFSNLTIYQNISQPGVPLFRDVSDMSGLKFRATYDEGAAFLDHDLDGDFDLVVAYCGGPAARIYENQGDGSLKIIAKSFIEGQTFGQCLGFSKCDWDNDGDIDISTRHVFRKNDLIETGTRGYVIATHTIPGSHITSATPSWFDWDLDGDQDCSLGNWTDVGHFYENTLYDAATPDSQRRYVRVRVVRDSDDVPRGLETEYGAVAQVFVEGDTTRYRRKSFVTSAGGYLNQNEYDLHFALPADPVPNDDAQDLYFDVRVDFNSNPRKGLLRVDRHVNPALGRIHLADLESRQITVFRSGRVELDGCSFEPLPGNGMVLTTSSQLALTSPNVALADPVPSPGTDWYVGTVFDTTLASGPLRLKEVIVDGIADIVQTTCSGPETNMALWDTTDPANPFVVGDHFHVDRFMRNHRNAYRTNMLLQPGREYRVVARVEALRGSTISAPLVNGPLTVHGGVSYQDLSPCDGSAVAGAGVDTATVHVAVRVAEDAGQLWGDLGYALAGTNGLASLVGTGDIVSGSPVTLDLTGAAANKSTILVAGTTALCRPLATGVLIPSPDALLPIVTDASGAWTQQVTIPASLPPGTTTYFHVWWSDAGAVAGRAASNALSATTAY